MNLTSLWPDAEIERLKALIEAGLSAGHAGKARRFSRQNVQIRSAEMIVATHYDAIKARAIALLTAPDGFNGRTADEIMSCSGWSMHNNIGVALCRARDEIAPPWGTRRVGSFNIGNFNKAAGEIARYMKEHKRHGRR
jgi:hypothetical protein